MSSLSDPNQPVFNAPTEPGPVGNPPPVYPTAAPQPQIVYQQKISRPSNGQAIAAMVLGIVSICFGVWAWVPVVGIFNMIVAIPLGVVGLVLANRGLKRVPEFNAGTNQAKTGLILSYISLGICAVTIVISVIFLIVAAATGSAAITELNNELNSVYE